MSNFKTLTYHPIKHEYLMASWFDNYFGQHNYGVQFDGEEKVYNPENHKMTTKDAPLPKEISSGEIEIDGFTLHVHNLDNGMRVIDTEDLERFFSDPNIKLTPEKAEELVRLIKGEQ